MFFFFVINFGNFLFLLKIKKYNVNISTFKNSTLAYYSYQINFIFYFVFFNYVVCFFALRLKLILCVCVFFLFLKSLFFLEKIFFIIMFIIIIIGIIKTIWWRLVLLSVGVIDSFFPFFSLWNFLFGPVLLEIG